MDIIAANSQIIFGGLLVLIALSVIGMFVFIACQTPNNDNQDQPTITYNQNGYKSSVSGYHTGKFTKNNTYNGRQ